jgi:hypothetical protein
VSRRLRLAEELFDSEELRAEQAGELVADASRAVSRGSRVRFSIATFLWKSLNSLLLTPYIRVKMASFRISSSALDRANRRRVHTPLTVEAADPNSDVIVTGTLPTPSLHARRGDTQLDFG